MRFQIPLVLAGKMRAQRNRAAVSHQHHTPTSSQQPHCSCLLGLSLSSWYSFGLSSMFVLGKGSGSGGSSSQLRTNLVFFGKLGLFFGAVRLVFVFMNKDDKTKAITSQ